MKTLIIHHLEKTWEHGYKNHGTSFEEMAKKVISHIKRAKYDKVILTQFESSDPKDEHFESGIYKFVDEWYEYGYAWTIEESDKTTTTEHGFILDEYGNKYTNGGNHSEVVLIEDWMLELSSHDDISICGAFEGECLEDLEIALSACSLKFRKIKNLIV